MLGGEFNFFFILLSKQKAVILFWEKRPLVKIVEILENYDLCNIGELGKSG